MDGRAAPVSGSVVWSLQMVQPDLVVGIDPQRPQVRSLHKNLDGGLFKGVPGDRSQPAQMVAA